jgi:murein DD-endopeptidase MepM/ murein hydrolase activator NlpD
MTFWVRPVNYPMNQMFGQIAGAAWGVTGPGGHPGTDYACPMGTVVGAASGGKVIVAGQSYDGGFGFHPVAIYHPDDNVTTLYGHMESHAVQVGQQVNPGQPIGLADSQGFSSGSHLHAELRRGNVAYGYYGDGITMDFDAWEHAHGAYGGTPWQPSGALTTADRTKIGKMQAILKVHVDGAWGKQTDDALQTIRWHFLSPPNHYPVSTQVALLQKLWGVTADGKWGSATDWCYNVWRYCYLNK